MLRTGAVYFKLAISRVLLVVRLRRSLTTVTPDHEAGSVPGRHIDFTAEASTSTSTSQRISLSRLARAMSGRAFGGGGQPHAEVSTRKRKEKIKAALPQFDGARSIEEASRGEQSSVQSGSRLPSAESEISTKAT